MSPLSAFRSLFSSKDEKPPRKNVAIIGAGAAGMAAAFALANHPEKFKVTVFDKQGVCGGVATSTPIDKDKFGAPYINDGVQGGSPQFYNTYKFFSQMGQRFDSSDVSMQISFGKGQEQFWTNVFPSELVAKHRDDIQKFGRVLKVIGVMEPIFAVMSVKAMLKVFGFPKEFGDRLIYPLIALFMGTGNQTPHVSSVILERLFLDPSMSLFEYNPDSLLAQIPTMKAFPELGAVYKSWKEYLEERCAVFKLGMEVTRVVRRDGKCVVLAYREVEEDEVQNGVFGGEERTEHFDEVIFAADADSCLKILGRLATWKERMVLGNVKYFWDISVTHWDREYMDKYYELDFNSDLVAKSRKDDPKDLEAQKKIRYAEDNFNPLYFIKMYDEDAKKIEMSFDLTNYQPQFKAKEENKDKNESVKSPHSSGGSKSHSSPKLETSNKADPSQAPSSKAPPHVFQTIFLNKRLSALWTKAQIDPSKVIMEKWWKQQGHNWTHYLGTVPWLWVINDGRCGWFRRKTRTRFAGGWGLVNMHEVAITSGFAAAYSLGAKYPYNDDPKASRLFSLILRLMYLRGMRKEDKKAAKAAAKH